MPAACNCKLLLETVVEIVFPVIVILPLLKVVAVTVPELFNVPTVVVPTTVKF